MRHTFTLHEEGWLRDGPVYANGQAIIYRVGGLPDGTTARLANFAAPNGNDWRIMRINPDDSQSDWTGNYQSVEEALAALHRDCPLQSSA
jgi:hypothetical protein